MNAYSRVGFLRFALAYAKCASLPVHFASSSDSRGKGSGGGGLSRVWLEATPLYGMASPLTEDEKTEERKYRDGWPAADASGIYSAFCF